MHEDAAIELSAFPPGGRVFCIASAGCTAMALSTRHEVVAADLNPAQVAYARSRFAGGAAASGSADRLMSVGRRLAVLAGWTRRSIGDFLELSDPEEQLDYWRCRLAGARLRVGLDVVLSSVVLRTVYAAPFLRALPPRFGRVMRERLERGFARHANRGNAYARALLAGESSDAPAPSQARSIRLVEADAAALLERETAGSFDGFTLSNILDGATDAYRERLLAAVRRAGSADAVAILRSFAEPDPRSRWNRAADDRAMLWGTVDVRPVADL